MKKNIEKRHYLPPGLTVVRFAAERGFAASGLRTLLTEFSLVDDPADALSTGEERSDQGWLF